METEQISDQVDAAMRKALTLALQGPAWGANPRVGCVILGADGVELSSGYHRGAGTAHAEVDALSKLAPGQASGATAVVTLEPCNHFGRTGPCTHALIKAGVAQVYYAVSDPGKESSGGAETLAAAGVVVHRGLLASEAEQINRRWFTAIRKQRPFVTLKWASTLDGRIAAEDGSSKWITGAAARQDVHVRRRDSDAILVGTGTALSDDPSLTALTPHGELFAHQPVPVVVGQRQIPATARVFDHPESPILFRGHDLNELLAQLHELRFRHVFVEGGAGLASAFLQAGLFDEVLVYFAPKLVGGSQLATGSIGVYNITEAKKLRFVEQYNLGEDYLLIAEPITEGQ